MEPERGTTVRVGDVLKIERRFVVNGALTTSTDRGRFVGIELVGSAEHLVLEDTRRRKVRLFPLSTVSEISVVKSAPREASPAPAAPATPSLPWDPGFA